MATLASAPSSVNAAGSWVNGSNAYASDNTYATLATTTSSDLDLRGFNFAAIPANSVINFVTCAIEHFEDATNQRTLTVTLMDGTTVIDGQNVTLRTVEGVDTVTFAVPPTLTQIKAATLQLRITGARTSGSTKNFSVDAVTLTADYTPPITGTSASTLDPATSSASGYAGSAVTGTSAQTLAAAASNASGYAGTAVTGTSAQTLSNAASAGVGFVGDQITGTSASTLQPATSQAQGNATVPIITLDYVELRLYTDLTATNFVLLPLYSDLSFDVKYNDIGAINFAYPLEAAETMGLADADLIGVVLGFSNGVTDEIDRFLIESTNDDRVSDGQRMRTFSGRSTLAILNDAKVYPSNWKVTTISTYSRTSNVATLNVGVGHGYGVAQKVFVVGIDSSFNGEVTLTSVTSTTISYASTGTNLGSTTAPASSFVVNATPSGHSFTDSTVGTIMRTLIDRAQARGGLLQIDESSFTGLVDSNNVSWGELHTQNYATGTDYFDLLNEFMERGYVDAWLDGWQLRMVNGGDRGAHVGIGTVEIRPARNVTEMVTTTNSAESASTVLIEGDEGTAVERHDSAAQALLGRRRERYVQQGGIRDAGVLTLLGNAELDLYGRIPTEETVGVAPNGLMPFVDFQISDWVWVRYKSDDAPVERRIRQIGVSVDQDRNITFGITLNSILYEADVALKRRMDALTGNGGTYGSVPNSIPDNSVPNAPTGLGITSGTYTDALGFYRAAFVANWSAPTTNVDGSTISDLDYYEVQYRYTGIGTAPQPTDTEWKPILRTADTETTLGYSPVQPGAGAEVRVRAIDADGHVSVWLTTTTTFDKDITPPNVPSQPDAVDAIGYVNVTWDGLDAGGNQLGLTPDFDRVEVWMSPSTAGFTPGLGDSVQVGIMQAKGTTACIGGVPNATCWYKLVAVDKAGNKSAASTSDTGKVLYSVVTDPGTAPSTSPTPTVIGGVGSLHVTWEPLVSSYPITYDIHVSTKSGFTPDITTLVDSTQATVSNIRFLRKNLILNGSFEAATPLKFTPSVGTVDIIDGTADTSPTDDPPSGAYVGKFTPSSAGAQYLEYTDNIPAVAGDKIRLSAWAQAPSGAQNFTASMRWFDASNNLLSTSTTSVTSAPVDTFAGVSETMQAPVGTAYGRYRFNLPSAASGQSVYVDLLQAVADDASEPLVYDTKYYVKIVARTYNLSGPASTEASDELYKVGNTEISAQYAYFGSVAADQITTGNLTATVGITTGKIQVGNLVIDPSGINIPLIDSTSGMNTGVISLPSTGANAKFIGVEVDATSINVQDKLTVAGNNNKIAGTVTIQQTIAAPQTGPTISVAQAPASEKVIPSPSLGTPSVYIGLWKDGTDWYTCSNDYYIYKINATTGATTLVSSQLVNVLKTYRPDFVQIVSITQPVKWGSSWYIAMQVESNVVEVGNYQTIVTQWSSNAFDNMGQLQGIWFSKQTAGWSTNTVAQGQKRPALYSDGANLHAMIPTGINSFKYVRFASANLGTWTVLATKTTATYENHSTAFCKPAAGTSDIGAGWLYYIGGKSNQRTLVKGFDANMNLNQAAYNFGDGADIGGIGHDGTDFWVLTRDSSASPIYLKRLPLNTTNKTITAANTWFDANGTTHETQAGPSTGYTQPARSWFTITTVAPPEAQSVAVEAANTGRIYARSDGGSPLRMQNAGGTSNALPVGTLAFTPARGTIDNATGLAPPGSNGFIGVATPGSIKSAAVDGALSPYIQLNGDGSGRLGPFAWDAAGVRTSDSGWISTGLVANNSTTITNCRYRVIDGVFVEIIGRCTTGAAVTVTTGGVVAAFSLFTLPAAYWPTQGGRYGPLVTSNTTYAMGEILVGVDGTVAITRLNGAAGSMASGATVNFSIGFFI